MAVQFRPDKFGVQVIHRYTSQTGRWIVFLGVHYNGTEQCWDVGMYRTHMGAVQRLHFGAKKDEAIYKYDQVKEQLANLKQHDEPDGLTVVKPDAGRKGNVS